MRDDGKRLLEAVNNRIEKAKTSLEEMNDASDIETLSMGLADQIPLGRFPEDKSRANRDETRNT